MNQNTAKYELAARAPADADPLLDFFKDHLGTPVTVSLAKVNRLDALRLQTLIVALKQWRTDQTTFSICDISKDCAANLELLGIGPEVFNMDSQK